MPTQADATPLHSVANPSWYYTTTNVGEAMPGVVTPLTWSVWGPASELAARYGFRQMGALESALAGVPDNPQDRAINIFYGRVAMSVNMVYEMGDRLPGTSGDAVASAFLGNIPPDLVPAPTKRRYFFVAARMPRAFLRSRRVLVKESKKVEKWWKEEIARTPTLDLASAQAQFREARAQFEWATQLQSQAMLIGVQPVYEQLQSLIESTEMQDEAGKLTGGGGSHAETDVVADLWEMARGRLTEEEFLARHGYHGPLEGDIAGRVWREDPTPVRKLLEQYRNRPDEQDPHHTALKRAEDREAAERELLRRLPAAKRPIARLVLRLARRNVPMRGIGKATFLKSLDVTRSAARRIGALLAERGVLDQADDVMYLTADEIKASIPINARELVRVRRAERERYQALGLPSVWKGDPEPLAVAADGDIDDQGALTGIGVSHGIVEGTVRVVTDPNFDDVEDDEILVAATTDPSWASIMFISSALVVDIGGSLSHAAVVARELGIPCVVNTLHGSRVLRTGDRVRVDGGAGTVEILKRAADESSSG